MGLFERSGVLKGRIIYLKARRSAFHMLDHDPLEVVKIFSISVDTVA